MNTTKLNRPVMPDSVWDEWLEPHMAAEACTDVGADDQRHRFAARAARWARSGRAVFWVVVGIAICAAWGGM